MRTKEINYKDFTTVVEKISNYAIFTLNQSGIITNWNNGAETISGWEKDEVVGKHYKVLFKQDDIKKGTPDKNLDQASTIGYYHKELEHVKKSGDTFLADTNIYPLLDSKSDKATDYIIIMSDVTKRKKSETDQADANKLLKQEIQRRKIVEKALKESNDELAAFATAAGHDLQEPLRMVVSYLQLIERRYKNLFDNDGREFLYFAVDGATRMKDLISDLVEYSRLDTLAKPMKQTDANLVLKNVLQSLKVSVNETGATITYEQLPMIKSEPVQLGELFQNLISNAIKFRGERPLKIHISVTQKDNEHIFMIQDNGKGIEKKDYEKIFLIFKQLGSRPTRQGSGIGLSIARKIVGRHNGRIWVKSVPNEGSAFYFSIPINNDKE